MNLWLAIALFTLLIALISFYPLLRGQTKSAGVKRDELNKAFYFDRLEEIEREEQQGLLNNAAQLKTELQQSLLEDIPAQAESAAADNTSSGRLWFISGTLTIAIVAAAVYLFIGAWRGEAQLVKMYENLPHFYQRMQQEKTNPMTPQEMEQFANALTVHLQKQPDDAGSWWLLGQLAMNLDKGQLAFDSYSRAHRLKPDNSEYKLAYARILMYSADPADKAGGEELLKQLIRDDHANLDALSLLALNYFEKEDYKMAAVAWAMILRLLPENDPKIPLLEKSIRSARDALEDQQTEKHRQIIPQGEK